MVCVRRTVCANALPTPTAACEVACATSHLFMLSMPLFGLPYVVAPLRAHSPLRSVCNDGHRGVFLGWSLHLQFIAICVVVRVLLSPGRHARAWAPHLPYPTAAATTSCLLPMRPGCVNAMPACFQCVDSLSAHMLHVGFFGLVFGCFLCRLLLCIVWYALANPCAGA